MGSRNESTVKWVVTCVICQVPVTGSSTNAQGRPSVPPAARRGTNVAVSKRTRFALQVQKPTGENSDNDSFTNVSLQG